MAPKPPSTGPVVGLNKGYIVTRRELPVLVHPIAKGGAEVFSVENEQEGLFRQELDPRGSVFAPYKKRITKLLKVCALKVAKRKLGSHKRAKRKRGDVQRTLQVRLAGGGEKKK